MDANTQIILDAHFLWLETNGEEGKRAYFRNFDGSGMSFAGMNLSQASFRGATLLGADFRGANLAEADFSEAIIERSNFRDANLERANLARVQGAGVYAEQAFLNGANLQGAQFFESKFIGARMQGIVGRETNFANCEMMLVDLQAANLRAANLTDAKFDEADLREADCREARFSHARFADTKIAGATLRGAKFDGVNFSRADFSKALELDPEYLAHSFDSEKRSLELEIGNLRKMRDDMSVFEQRIKEDRQQIEIERQTFRKLGQEDETVIRQLAGYTNRFRAVSIVWFIAVAAFGTMVFYQYAKPDFSLSQNELFIALGAMALVLCLHLFTAASAISLSNLVSKTAKERLGIIHPGDVITPNAEMLPPETVAQPRKAA